MNKSLLLPFHYTYITVLLIFWIIPLNNLNGYCWTPDTLTRVNPNDSFIGSYYFWWTNLTYLPLFFFLFLFGLHYIITSKLKLSIGLTLTFLILLIYAVELLDYLALNSLDEITLYSYYGINTLLTNVLNRYHPFVFYLSAGLLLVSFFEVLKCHALLAHPFKSHINAERIFHFLWLLVTINLIALWMGSWWALQEGTWGGWWNWDSSEMFGLIVSFIGLSIHHTNWTLRSTTLLVSKFILLITIFLASYFFIQLNFDLVSHNFGAKFFSLFNDNLFFFEVLSLISLLTLYYLKRMFYWSTLNNVFIFKRKNVLSVLVTYRILVIGIALGWVLWSYKPLLNYFLWNFAELNVFNSEYSLQPLNFFALTLLFTWLITPQWGSTIISSFLICVTPHWLFTTHFHLTSFSKFGILHLTLLCLSSLNIILYDLSFTYWTSLGHYELFYSSTHVYSLSSPEWVVDTTLIDSVGSWLSLEGTYLPMWNTFINSNAPAINFFLLCFSHFSFENVYILGSLYSMPSLLLEVPSVLTLNTFFVSLIALKQLITWFVTPPVKT